MTDQYDTLLRHIIENEGMLLPAQEAGVKYLGYPTSTAAGQALWRGTYPVPVIRLPGRKPEIWVRATDLVAWLASLAAEQAGGAA